MDFYIIYQIYLLGELVNIVLDGDNNITLSLTPNISICSAGGIIIYQPFKFITDYKITSNTCILLNNITDSPIQLLNYLI